MRKVLLTALSVVLIVFSLAGCLTDNRLEGTWQTTINLADDYNSAFSSAEDDIAEYLSVDEFNIVYNITFNSNGTYSQYVNEDEFKKTIDNLKAHTRSGLTKYYEQEIKENKLDMTVDEMLSYSNLTMDELVDDFVTEEIYDQMVEAFKGEGNYLAADGQLHMSESLDTVIDPDVYETYTVNGDTFTITGQSDTEFDQDLEKYYPVKYVKVK